MELVYRVVARVVEAEDNVALNAIGVVYEEVGNRRSVRDEEPANALGRDLVLSVLIWPQSAIGRGVLREGSCSEERYRGRQLGAQHGGQVVCGEASK